MPTAREGKLVEIDEEQPNRSRHFDAATIDADLPARGLPSLPEHQPHIVCSSEGQSALTRRRIGRVVVAEYKLRRALIVVVLEPLGHRVLIAEERHDAQ